MSDVTNGSSNSRPTRPAARPFSGRPRSGQTTQSEPLRGRPHPRPFAPPVTPPPPTTTMATPAAVVAIDWTTGPLTPVEPPGIVPPVTETAATSDLVAPVQAVSDTPIAEVEATPAEAAPIPEPAVDSVEVEGEFFNVSVVSLDQDAPSFAIGSVEFAEPEAPAAPSVEQGIDASHDYPTPPLGIEAIEAAWKMAATAGSPAESRDVVVAEEPFVAEAPLAAEETFLTVESLPADEPFGAVESFEAAARRALEEESQPIEAAAVTPPVEADDILDADDALPTVMAEPVETSEASADEVTVAAEESVEELWLPAPESETVVVESLAVSADEPAAEIVLEPAEPEPMMLDEVLSEFVVRDDERARSPEPIPGLELDDDAAEAELQSIAGPQLAAEVLEAIARRIRGGEIVVASPAAQSGDAAVLAAVLATLLTKRD